MRERRRWWADAQMAGTGHLCVQKPHSKDKHMLAGKGAQVDTLLMAAWELYFILGQWEDDGNLRKVDARRPRVETGKIETQASEVAARKHAM